MSLINCCRRLLTINKYFRNIDTRKYYNLKNVKCITLKCYNLNDYRFLSSNAKNIKNKKSYDPFTYLDLNFREQKKIYNDDVVAAIEDVEFKGIMTEENALFLIQCCGHTILDGHPEKKVSLAERVWEIFQNTHTKKDIQHYNTMLQCYIENQMPVSYRNFLDKMACEPNEKTYHLLLKCVCENGEINQATDIVNIMKENGLSANEPVFSSLILGHLRSCDIKSARNILSTMKLANLTPGALTYTELLRGHAELKDEFTFSAIVDEAISSGNLNHENLNSIVRSIANTENIHLLPKLKKSFPNIVSSRSFQTNLTSLCIHLIYLNKPEIAYETFKNLVDPEVGFLSESDTYASVLLYEMARAHTEPEKVIKITDDLIETKRNELAIFKALECSLQVLNTNLAISLLKHLHSKDIKLRNHYFWPLLIQAAKNNGQTGVFDIFQIMADLDVDVEYETLEKYSLNYIENLDTDVLITRLKELNITVTNILTPLTVVLLRTNRIKDVADVCNKYKIKLNGEFVIKPLSLAFLSTFDVKNTIDILKYIDNSKKSIAECNGQLLIYLLNKPLKNVNFKEIIILLQAYTQNKLKITSHNMDRLEYLTQRITDQDIKSKILMLSNALVDHSQINNNINTHIPHPRDMNLEQLECHLIELNNKKMETRGVLRKLLQMHCRVGNIQRVQELLDEFIKAKYKMSVGMKAGLLDLYIKSDNLKLALEIYNEIIEKDPSFVLDEFKVIDLASLLVTEDNFEEAVRLLKTEIQNRKIRGGKSIEPNCWGLLNSAAQVGNISETKNLFELLTNSGLCVPSNVILGPLIRVQLNNNILKDAVEEYVHCCKKYRETPLQHELLCKLVDTECSTDLIKKVIDATGQIHGINSAKMALTAALAETGKYNTLKEFLMEQKTELSTFLLEQHCNRWIKEGNIVPLKTLVKSKKYISDNNQNVIYQSMIRIYCANNDWENALSLWNELQDKDFALPKSVKNMLTTLLVNNNHPLACRI